MEKETRKLDIKDAASLELINSTESPAPCDDFDIAKEKITNLKNDAAETAECLSSINSTIKEYLAKVEKLKKLEI